MFENIARELKRMQKQNKDQSTAIESFTDTDHGTSRRKSIKRGSGAVKLLLLNDYYKESLKNLHNFQTLVSYNNELRELRSIAASNGITRSLLTYAYRNKSIKEILQNSVSLESLGNISLGRTDPRNRRFIQKIDQGLTQSNIDLARYTNQSAHIASTGLALFSTIADEVIQNLQSLKQKLVNNQPIYPNSLTCFMSSCIGEPKQTQKLFKNVSDITEQLVVPNINIINAKNREVVKSKINAIFDRISPYINLKVTEEGTIPTRSIIHQSQKNIRNLKYTKEDIIKLINTQLSILNNLKNYSKLYHEVDTNMQVAEVVEAEPQTTEGQDVIEEETNDITQVSSLVDDDDTLSIDSILDKIKNSTISENDTVTDPPEGDGDIAVVEPLPTDTVQPQPTEETPDGALIIQEKTAYATGMTSILLALLSEGINVTYSLEHLASLSLDDEPVPAFTPEIDNKGTAVPPPIEDKNNSKVTVYEPSTPMIDAEKIRESLRTSGNSGGQERDIEMVPDTTDEDFDADEIVNVSIASEDDDSGEDVEFLNPEEGDDVEETVDIDEETEHHIEPDGDEDDRLNDTELDMDVVDETTEHEEEEDIHNLDEIDDTELLDEEQAEIEDDIGTDVGDEEAEELVDDENLDEEVENNESIEDDLRVEEEGTGELEDEDLDDEDSDEDETAKKLSAILKQMNLGF